MAKRKADDEIAITIKLRGEPKAVIAALVNGLPKPALEKLRDRMALEVENRRAKPSARRRRVKIEISGRK